MNILSKIKQSFRNFGSSVFYAKTVTHLWPKLICMVCVLILAVIMYVLDLGCVWNRILQIPCPGCQMTRAFIALFSGDILGAFRYHYMFPSVFILILYIIFDGRIFKNKSIDRLILSLIFSGYIVRWVTILL